MIRTKIAILLAAFLAVVTTSAPASAGSTVSVFYAGSLSGINTNDIGPAFNTQTGITFTGQGTGSVAIANGIKSGIYKPDVAEFADAAVNKLLQGSANGNYVKWWINSSTSHLVIGWDPNSKFAPLFKKARRRQNPVVQATPGQRAAHWPDRSSNRSQRLSHAVRLPPQPRDLQAEEFLCQDLGNGREYLPDFP